MRATEYDHYRSLSVDDYCADLCANFEYSVATSRAECERVMPATLAEAMEEPGHAMLVIEVAAQCVGYVWLHLDGPAGHLLDFIVEPAHRGLGHGRRALELIQARLRAEGAQSLQLRVAANNPRARALYEQAGLYVTGQLMAKTLVPTAPPGPAAGR